MKETPGVWQYRLALPGMQEETSFNPLSTWEVSFKLLGDIHSGKLGDVLTLFGVLHTASIREQLFRHDIGDSDHQFAASPIIGDIRRARPLESREI